MLPQVRIELGTFKLKPLKGFRKVSSWCLLKQNKYSKLPKNSKGLELSKMSLFLLFVVIFCLKSTKYLLLIHRQ